MTERKPSGLSSEDRLNIKRLQLRKKQIGCYGDCSGVRSEQREIQAQINRIKEVARAKANAKVGSGIKPSVPWNVYVDA